MPLPKSMIEAELPARAQQGDENALAALIARMMPAIRKGAADCTAPGLDFDDAVQEGLIGLFRAVREYDPAVGPTFAAFAAASIRHAQQDARRAALRKKHAPLNFSVPLPDAQQSTDTRPGPEEIAISGEQYADTMRRMQTELSENELSEDDLARLAEEQAEQMPKAEVEDSASLRLLPVIAGILVLALVVLYFVTR